MSILSRSGQLFDGGRRRLAAVSAGLFAGFVLLHIIAEAMSRAVDRLGVTDAVTGLFPVIAVLFGVSFAFSVTVARIRQLPEGWKRLSVVAVAPGSVIAAVGLMLMKSPVTIPSLVLALVLGTIVGAWPVIAWRWVREGFREQAAA